MALLLVPEERGGCDAEGHEGDDEVFAGREFTAVENDIHEHNRNEFA